jgi:hypothetical protein
MPPNKFVLICISCSFVLCWSLVQIRAPAIQPREIAHLVLLWSNHHWWAYCFDYSHIFAIALFFIHFALQLVWARGMVQDYTTSALNPVFLIGFLFRFYLFPTDSPACWVRFDAASLYSFTRSFHQLALCYHLFNILLLIDPPLVFNTLKVSINPTWPWPSQSVHWQSTVFAVRTLTNVVHVSIYIGCMKLLQGSMGWNFTLTLSEILHFWRRETAWRYGQWFYTHVPACSIACTYPPISWGHPHSWTCTFDLRVK